MHAFRIALLCLLAAVPAARGQLRCGGCLLPAPTLRDDATACKVLVFGTLANPTRTATGGTTDVVVSRVLKSHPAVAGKAVITIDRFIEPTDPPPTFLLFGDVHQGKVDFYRGEVAGPAVADYVAGVLAFDPKDHARRLRYCAKFLDHHEPAVATDAFTEFSRAADPDVRAAARAIDPDRLRRLLRSPETLDGRLGLYAILLAHAGNRSDAALVRELLDGGRAAGTAARELLTAFTLLDPPAGWDYTCDRIRDPRAGFLDRYAGLLAARYFHATRPDVVGRADLVKALSLALRHSDMADLAIDDLRKWRCWERTDQVLGLHGLEEFDVPLVRRTMLRYALQAPGKAAAEFVWAACLADPKGVEAAQAFLKEEGKSRR